MRARIIGIEVGALLVMLAGVAAAQCQPDAVRVGPLCVDRYEASVWKIAPTNTALIAAVQAGTITDASQLSAAIRRGESSDDYGPACPDNGAGCVRLYAVSIPGVKPSAFLTWFQAAAACRNAGKRLLSSAEWQVAALGTPDPGTDDDATDCNTTNDGPGDPGATGSRSLCASDVGLYDMSGNVWEWVADWTEFASDCDLGLGGDYGCIGGFAGATNLPAAIMRGGSFIDGTAAGPYAIAATNSPSSSNNSLGFRCARPAP